MYTQICCRCGGILDCLLYLTSYVQLILTSCILFILPPSYLYPFLSLLTATILAQAPLTSHTAVVQVLLDSSLAPFSPEYVLHIEARMSF